MKKILTLLFIAMPLFGNAYCWKQHEYQITFTDGKIVEPIYTKTYGSNWEFNTYFWYFYFNNNDFLAKNLEIIKKCGVGEHVVNTNEYKFIENPCDGYICFKNIKDIKEIK